MRYAHIADLHLGSWRDQRMRDISLQAFFNAIDDCVNRNVDFILFAGDLFNTSLPSLDVLKLVVTKLRELRKKEIPIYVIAGSHDFSPSGKTMLEVLENAGLMINVCKGSVNPETKQLKLNFVTDHKTNAKITGIIGRRGLLDKNYYENLDRESLEAESGYKIFMFHTTLTELKPKHLEMLESQPASFLPKGFNYYAGGHIHHTTKVEITDYGTMTYPGALFPNNFLELEKYSFGGYYIINFDEDSKEGNTSYNNSNNIKNSEEGSKQQIEWIPIKVKDHIKFVLDCKHKTPEEVLGEVNELFSNQDVKDKLITIRLFGELSDGRVSDIKFQDLFTQLYSEGAHFVMKNSSQLTNKGFEEIKLGENEASQEEVEEGIIKEHLQQFKTFEADKEFQLVKTLIQQLNTKKKEGEKSYDFQDRVVKELDVLLEK
jgi:DNA repair protein SbcD/Mre11